MISCHQFARILGAKTNASARKRIRERKKTFKLTKVCEQHEQEEEEEEEDDPPCLLPAARPFLACMQ
jgi:hypothetical protein